VAELERQLGGRVMYQEVSEIDLIHKHMTVDVRLRPGPGGPTRRPDEHATTTETPPTTVGSGNGVTPAGGVPDGVPGRTGDGRDR
jgi:hypothetical protein